MTEWGAQSTIGAYRILETLGAGGMGTVHRAEHRLTGEIVALKTVRARSPEAFAAIRREIAALARLDHPGIVRIRAEGVHEGSPWYAMDLLPWPTLRRRVFADAERSLDEATAPTEILRSHFWTMALTPPAAPRASPGGGRRRPPGSRRGIDRGDLDLILTLAARLAGALSYLHGEGIVHRDLKPENVLVGPGDGPVLVDFGLWSTGSGSGKDSLDPGGDIAGTAAYMSPEQARGEMADARSDLYALGCILFELLTARPVFDARSSFDMLGHHLRAEPRAPGARTKGIPPALDELVIALLSKDPRRRPGFAADVEEALVRLGARREERPAPRAAFHLHRPSLRGRRDALDRAMDLVLSGRRGKGALLLVDGSSGMGRTRFANEVGSRARSRGLWVLAGVGGDAGPLGAMTRPLRQIVDHLRTASREACEAAIGPWIGVLALHDPLFATLPLPPRAAPPIESGAARRRLLRAAGELVLALASESPVLLVLDDLHRADDLSRAFVEHIARGSRERLSLLGTFRTEEQLSMDRLLALGERITLGALDDRAVEETAMEMLATPSLPRDVLDAFARAGQGTPRQLGETLRLAADEGWLRRSAQASWSLDPASLALLPRSAAEIAARRMVGLEPAARSLLVACAILAVESPEERLQRFADLDDGAFLEASRILVQRRLVETAPPARLRLTYDSVGAEALAPIGGAELRELHLRAAALLRGAPEPGALSARARHLDLAGSARDAAKVYQSAGMEAANRYAAAEGRACYERSLALYLELGDEALVAQALQSLAKLELWSGHIMPARDHLHRALEIAKRVSEEAEARVHLDLDELLHHLGDFPGAEAHCELALCHFRARGPSFDLANALAHKTGALTMQGRWREARAPLAEAMAMPVPGDVQLAALLLFYGCLVADGLGEWEEARRLGLRTLDHFQRSGTPDDVAAILCRLGEAEVLRGEIDDGMQRLEESLAIFREIDYAVNEAGVLVLLGKLHREQGDRDRAREEIDRGLRIAERFDSDGSRIEAWMQQVWLGIEDRDLALAASLGERVLATATKRGMQNLASEAHRALAAIARADLDVESAAEHLSLARALCERTGHRYELALVACEEGRLCVGRGGDARSILAGVEQEQRALGARPGSAIGRAVGALRGAIEGR